MTWIKTLGQWLWKNRKWLVPLVFNAYELIAKQIKKIKPKDQPVANTPVPVEEEKPDQDPEGDCLSPSSEGGPEKTNPAQAE